MEQWYDSDEDVLNLQISDKPYWKSVELSDSIIVDIAKDGSIIAIEVLHASKVFSGDGKKVLEIAKVAA